MYLIIKLKKMHPNIADKVAHVVITERGIPGKSGSFIEEQKTLHEENELVTGIVMS